MISLIHSIYYNKYTTNETMACICLLDSAGGVSQDRCCKILRYTHQTGAVDLNYQVIHLDPGGEETKQLSGTWDTGQC